MSASTFLLYVQSAAVLLIGVYTMCSLGMAAFSGLRGQGLGLREWGTPIWRSFGDWAPLSLRILMFLRRTALFAAIVLLATGLYLL